MTSKERVQAAFAGHRPDRMPVSVPYVTLYHQDHFTELTGQPPERFHKWLYAPRDEFIATLRVMAEAAPFDILQAPYAPSASYRRRMRYVEEDGRAGMRDTETGRIEWLAASGSGHAADYAANETAMVQDIRDIREKIAVVRAEEQIRDGAVERQREIVEAFGKEKFLVTGNVVGTIYGTGGYVGQTNALTLFLEKPDFMHEVCKRYTERNIEWIRTVCSAGGDAVYVDDATATSDMISPALYEEFCLPYLKLIVQEAHAHNHKIFLVYFGGVMDRLEQIASTGADGLLMEASMKGYVNDLGEAARRVGDRLTLFGNLNPYDHLEILADAALEAEMRRQAEAGRRARGFIMSTGSPVTMGTPLARVRRFIDLARGMSC